MPAATAAFDEPLPLEARAPVPVAELRAPPDVFRALLPELRDAELRLRDDADDVRRLDAVPPLDLLFPLRLLREAVDLLVPFGLDPFELREPVCLLFVERVPPWAIAPP